MWTGLDGAISLTTNQHMGAETRVLDLGGNRTLTDARRFDKNKTKGPVLSMADPSGRRDRKPVSELQAWRSTRAQSGLGEWSGARILLELHSSQQHLQVSGSLRSPATVRSLWPEASRQLLPAQSQQKRAWLPLWGADVCCPDPHCCGSGGPAEPWGKAAAMLARHGGQACCPPRKFVGDLVE